MSNIYFAKQLYGTRVRAVITAIQEYLSQYTTTLNYLSTLSINSAKEKHLEMIGKLMGFERPIINSQAFAESLFRFTQTYSVDPNAGLAYTYDTTGGGLLDYLSPNYAYLDLTEYRKILKIIAQIGDSKSLYMIDKIAAIYDTSYTIEWDIYGDIIVTLNTAGIYKVATCQYVFDKVYTASPRIQVRRGL